MAGFRLGEWTVRPEDGSVTSTTGGATRLEPLLMELLVYLCSRAGQVVSKQDLLDAIWQNRFVSDDAVKGCFYQLRKALGDSPRKPRLIETLPKRGYRMLVQPAHLSETRAEAINQVEELYRKGHSLLSEQPNAATLKQARLYLERATEADPRHAQAMASLAHTLILLLTLGSGSGAELLARAGNLASRALELNPRLAAAHLALGVVRVLHDHDMASAEQEFRHAIALEPASSASHRWYARFLSCHARHNEALIEIRQALEDDPLSLALRRDLLDILFMARLYDESLAEAHRLLEAPGHAPDVQLGLVWLHYLCGREQQAFEAFRAGLQSLGVASHLLQQAADAFQRGAMVAVFRLWVELLESQAALGHKAIDLLPLYALLGENDRCFRLLDLIYREEHPYLLSVPVSPLFDRLRADPRYLEFVHRLGLPRR